MIGRYFVEKNNSHTSWDFWEYFVEKNNSLASHFFKLFFILNGEDSLYSSTLISDNHSFKQQFVILGRSFCFCIKKIYIKIIYILLNWRVDQRLLKLNGEAWRLGDDTEKQAQGVVGDMTKSR